MKRPGRLILVLTILLSMLLSACKPNDPPVNPPDQKEYVTLFFNGDCQDKEVREEKGFVPGSVEKIGLLLKEPDPTREFMKYVYINENTGMEFDFSQPVLKDTQVSVMALYNLPPEIPPQGDDVIQVEAIDAPNCRYVDSQGATRYQVLLKPGDSFQIETVILPENASDKSIRYVIEDSSIVSVSPDSLLKALHFGDTYVWPVAAKGVNIGIKIGIYGMDMKVELADKERTYSDDENIDFNTKLTWYRVDGKFEYDQLLSDIKMEIVSGPEDLLIYHNGILSVIKEPEKEEKVRFRFYSDLDKEGIDYSNELEVTIKPRAW